MGEMNREDWHVMTHAEKLAWAETFGGPGELGRRLMDEANRHFGDPNLTLERVCSFVRNAEAFREVSYGSD